MLLNNKYYVYIFGGVYIEENDSCNALLSKKIYRIEYNYENLDDNELKNYLKSKELDQLYLLFKNRDVLYLIIRYQLIK